MKKFEIISSENVLNERWIKVEKQIVKVPNGDKKEWFITKGEDAVIIIPITKDKKILVQENYKHGSGKIVLEFPAGMVDKDEKIKDAAERELLEETGYKARELIKIIDFFASPTTSPIKYHVFLGMQSKKVSKQNLESDEQIITMEVELEELKDKIFNEKKETSSGFMSAFCCLLNNQEILK